MKRQELFDELGRGVGPGWPQSPHSTGTGAVPGGHGP